MRITITRFTKNSLLTPDYAVEKFDGYFLYICYYTEKSPDKRFLLGGYIDKLPMAVGRIRLMDFHLANSSASGAGGIATPRAALGAMDGEAQVSAGLTRDPPAPVER
jgi:hypothetical protein